MQSRYLFQQMWHKIISDAVVFRTITAICWYVRQNTTSQHNASKMYLKLPPKWETCAHRHSIIATARVLPKATQRELFRLGAYPRYSQSHYRQRYFSEL